RVSTHGMQNQPWLIRSCPLARIFDEDEEQLLRSQDQWNRPAADNPLQAWISESFGESRRPAASWSECFSNTRNLRCHLCWLATLHADQATPPPLGAPPSSRRRICASGARVHRLHADPSLKTPPRRFARGRRRSGRSLPCPWPSPPLR